MEKREKEESPTINITGEKVCLGPFHPGLIACLHRWNNDFSVSMLSGDPLRPKTQEEARAEYDRDSQEARKEYIGFVLYELATMRLIGLTELRRISYRDRTATYGILIGERDCWNKGYGTEATILMLDYGFRVLNLHNIMLATYGYNEAAIRTYTRAGFRLIGRRREAHSWGNRLYDEVLMDCISTDFTSPLKPVIELP